jgi:hypothetical protein
MAASDPVDVSRPALDARAEAERWAVDDPAYAENMAILAELGELLDSGQGGEFVAECHDFARASAALEPIMQRNYDHERALAVARWERRNDG